MWRSVLLYEDSDDMPSGRSHHYVLDEPVIDVIGLSCLVRISHPRQVLGSSSQIVRVGDAFELGLEPLTTFRAFVRVRIQGRQHDLGQLPVLHPNFAELRLDWHTSGKTYLRVDGRLIGYHDALGAGARLTITDVAFGFPEPVSATPDPDNRIDQFYLRVRSRRAPWARRRPSSWRPAGRPA